jgi:hypothetical protein
MKSVTFSVPGPLGPQRRLGTLAGERIVDLTGWLRGQHKSREAAEQALEWFATRTLGSDDHGLDGAALPSTGPRSSCSHRCPGHP